MSGPAMLAHLLLERLSRRVLARIPESDLVMHDPTQVAAFANCGRDEGLLAFTHLFHALQITPLVRPGDRVLDLACGPATQLAQVARLNPHARFVGLDASTTMLDMARTTLAHGALDNVELTTGDMTRLTGFGDASMDCVMCTMSLHHLPDTLALARTLREVRRVLKPGGALYLVDFGRFKRTRTQHFFAHDRRDCQSAQFTQDYLQSLKAAFSVTELRDAIALLGPDVVCYQTPLAPFMVVFKSMARRALDGETQSRMRQAHASLMPAQQQDFRVFARWFRSGGYALPCALA
ncbi:MAG: class I SAM-dependent methyltransferase [Rhodoferax sp.]